MRNLYGGRQRNFPLVLYYGKKLHLFSVVLHSRLRTAVEPRIAGGLSIKNRKKPSQYQATLQTLNTERRIDIYL